MKEFQSCLDKTPAVPFNEIKAIIRQELGRPLEEVTYSAQDRYCPLSHHCLPGYAYHLSRDFSFIK